MKLLREIMGVSITPAERERAGLPSSIMRILPGAQEDADELPIKPRDIKWKRLDSPERLSRTFEFDQPEHLVYFVKDVLDHQLDVQHHGTLTVGERDVDVEVYTHNVDQVTELDLEYTRFLDMLYDDVVQRRIR